ncbi:uncharacterized protein LOC107616865 [Arachis ipaensis]|uniref:uncharacterized protein LOC107616865 n=1 Tax=Arachis ipaensis TaxID=130454 RepID=UPI000A2B05E5|nr:uncharacterized protein LOC107616865 [Arachis ipaensis]
MTLTKAAMKYFENLPPRSVTCFDNLKLQQQPQAPFSPQKRKAGEGWSASDGCRGLGGRRAFVATAPTPRRCRCPPYIAAVELASVEEAQRRWFRRVSAVEPVPTTAADHTHRERGCAKKEPPRGCCCRREAGLAAVEGRCLPPPSPKIHHRSCWARRMLLLCRRNCPGVLPLIQILLCFGLVLLLLFWLPENLDAATSAAGNSR